MISDRKFKIVSIIGMLVFTAAWAGTWYLGIHYKARPSVMFALNLTVISLFFIGVWLDRYRKSLLVEALAALKASEKERQAVTVRMVQAIDSATRTTEQLAAVTELYHAEKVINHQITVRVQKEVDRINAALEPLETAQ